MRADNKILITAQDYTEVIDHENVLEEMQKTAKIGFWSVDLAKGIPWWSSGTYRIHKVSPDEEFELGGAIDFYVGESKDRLIADFGACASEGTPFDGVYRFKNAKGELLWVRSIGQAIRDSEGKVHNVSGLFQDVTREKEVENEITAVKDRLALAFGASGMGVWEFNVAEQTLIWDDRIYQIYGISREQYPKPIDAWESVVLEEDQRVANRIFEEAIQNKQLFDTSFRIRWSDGSLRHIKSMGKLNFDENGQPTRILGVNWDITDSVNQQEQLRLARDKAQKANRAKSEFLSNMSHEIRTPMNGILGFLELLLEGDLREDQRSQLEIIQKSGNSLLSIINDILDYSKIEAGHLKIKRKATPIRDLICDIENIFKPIVESKDLSLKFHYDFIQQEEYWLDPLRINQILTNLIGNAVKFTNRGRIDVFIEYDEH